MVPPIFYFPANRSCELAFAAIFRRELGMTAEYAKHAEPETGGRCSGGGGDPPKVDPSAKPAEARASRDHGERMR